MARVGDHSYGQWWALHLLGSVSFDEKRLVEAKQLFEEAVRDRPAGAES